MIKKYVTVKENEGKNLQEISSIMCSQGYKMNHNTVRNIINSSFFKIIKEINEKQNLHLTKTQMIEISMSNKFQTTIADLLND